MTYQAQRDERKQNTNKRTQNGAPHTSRRTDGAPRTNTPRVQKGANTYNRATAKSTGQRPVSGKRSASLPAERRSSNTSVYRKFIRPMLLVKQDNVETVKVSAKKPFPVGAVVMVTICTLLLMFTVMSYVQINEYTIEVALLRGELTDLAGEKKELALALEEKNDMLKIEEYAVENLGMVKSDQLTKKHITLDQEDKVEVVETEPTQDATVVSSVMSAIGENFRGLWEYMSDTDNKNIS